MGRIALTHRRCPFRLSLRLRQFAPVIVLQKKPIHRRWNRVVLNALANEFGSAAEPLGTLGAALVLGEAAGAGVDLGVAVAVVVASLSRLVLQ